MHSRPLRRPWVFAKGTVVAFQGLQFSIGSRITFSCGNKYKSCFISQVWLLKAKRIDLSKLYQKQPKQPCIPYYSAPPPPEAVSPVTCRRPLLAISLFSAPWALFSGVPPSEGGQGQPPARSSSGWSQLCAGFRGRSPDPQAGPPQQPSGGEEPQASFSQSPPPPGAPAAQTRQKELGRSDSHATLSPGLSCGVAVL